MVYAFFDGVWMVFGPAWNGAANAPVFVQVPIGLAIFWGFSIFWRKHGHRLR